MTKVKPTSTLALEEAREAVVKIRTLKPLLSPMDQETLVTLMDKELMGHLDKSLKEAERGQLEPLKNILIQMYQRVTTLSAKRSLKKLPLKLREEIINATKVLEENQLEGEKLSGSLNFLYSFL